MARRARTVDEDRQTSAETSSARTLRPRGVSALLQPILQRGFGPVLGAMTLVVLLLLPLRIGTFGEFVLQIGFIYVIVALGLHVLVHWAGQISFGHIAFAALGAHVTARLGAGGRPLWQAIPIGVLACLVAGVLVGIPALRIRGFHLAIVTFAFGYTADRWLFRQSWLTGASEGLGGNEVARPQLFGVTFTDAGLYVFILVVLCAVIVGLVRLRRTKGGRALIAVRDSEELAGVFGINVEAYKIFAFVISSGVAGLGGGLWAYALRAVDDTAFPIGLSILFVSLVVIGGPGPIWGTLVVALQFGVIPPLLGPGPAEWFGLIGPLGLLLIILQYPGGQVQAGRAVTRYVRSFASRTRHAQSQPTPSDAVTGDASGPGASLQHRKRSRAAGDIPALAIEGISVRFGGLQALQSVSLVVEPGKVTGLIGPNGAGKSTLLNCISGLQRPASGRVLFGGSDISKVPAHRRSRLGIGRTFQQLALCPEETVITNLLIAQYRLTSYNALRGVLGLPGVARAEAALSERATENLEVLGLGPVADQEVRNLPLGTAKLVELACALACSPRVLLLDEPTGGLSRDETGLLRNVLVGLRKRGDLSILLISHDMRLIMDLSDHIHVLNFGQILADGRPVDIRRNAAVIEAYLGTAKTKTRVTARKR